MIKRNILEEIINTTKHFPVTIVSGPRQVGKSTLLYNEFVKLGYDYVSLDDTFERNLAINDPLTFLNNHKTPLIIDEAQKAKELFVEIEKIVNDVRLKKGNEEANGMYILSGSESKSLLQGAKESLAGRAAIIKMQPLSTNEIFERKDAPFTVDLDLINKRSKDFTLDNSNLYELIHKGHMPGLYADNEISVNRFFSSYIQLYLERDVPEVLDIKNETKFLNFLRLAAANISQELIYDNFSRNLGVTSATIKSWIDVLVSTGIVRLVEPYNETSLKKRIVKRPKLYFFDTGLAAYLIGLRDVEGIKNSYLKGALVENYIMNEIYKSYINSGVDYEMFYYRDTSQNEIDLVLNENGNIHLLECKAGTNYNLSDIKQFSELNSSKLNKGNSGVVCLCNKLSAISNNIYLIPLSSI